MSLLVVLGVCLIAIHDVHGMQCSRKQAGDESWLVKKIEDIYVNCPRPIVDKESESFCCYSNDYSQFSCCGFSDFVTSPLFTFWLGIAFLVLLVVAIIILAIKFLNCILDMCCGIVNYLHRKL